MMSQVLNSKIHCKFSANDKRDGEFNVYIHGSHLSLAFSWHYVYTLTWGSCVYRENASDSWDILIKSFISSFLTDSLILGYQPLLVTEFDLI